jgi:hypothetical protein
MKKTMIALSLALISASASAEVVDEGSATYVTSTQTQQFQGIAGKDSGNDGVLPFSFLKFDSSLGNLTGVFFRSVINVNGGLIGADNTTNEQVNGSGYIGASVQIGDTTNDGVQLLDGSFKPIFGPQSFIKDANFTLYGDPTLSVGGNGSDVFVMNGTSHVYDSGFLSVSSVFFNQYLGSDYFNIGFDTTSEVSVSALGAQNTFKTANVDLGLELYYQYEDFPEPEIEEPPVSNVPTPFGIASLGLGLLGFGAARRKKQ